MHNHREEDFRAYIQEKLREEADKPEQEIDTSKIEALVKLLDEDGQEKPEKPKYEDFIAQMNSKYGTNIKSSSQIRKSTLDNKYLTIKLSYRLVASIITFVLAFATSDFVVKAYTDRSLVSWITKAKDAVVFQISNTTYEGWTVKGDNINLQYGTIYYENPDNFEDMVVETRELELDDIDWSKTMKLNYVPEGFEVAHVFEMSFGDNNGKLIVEYTNILNGEYISLDVEQFSYNEEISEKRFVNNVEFDSTLTNDKFSSYIFTGENYKYVIWVYDGKVYKINTTVSKSDLIKILESADYFVIGE